MYRCNPATPVSYHEGVGVKISFKSIEGHPLLYYAQNLEKLFNAKIK